MQSNTGKCHSCGAELDFAPGAVGRGEECLNCRADVRVCLNCSHYDPGSYNECRESMAERVVDKDRRNFCDYFSLGSPGSGGGVDKTKEDALKKFDDLFK
jgi:hypothetical protein